MRPSMPRWLALLALAAIAAAADPWERLSEAASAPPAQAQQALEALLLERPGFHAAHYDLGTLLLGSDPNAAADHLEAATAASDIALAADAWHNLALARLAQGRLDEALAAAVRSADLNPALAADRDRVRAAVLVALDEARRRAEEAARKLRIPRAELPRGAVGEPYDEHVAAAGGAAGYRFAVAGKTELPKGLALDPDGRLHGRPEAAQRFELTLQVSDSASASATGAVTLTVLPPPAITTAALPEAIAGQHYHAALAASALTSPRWSAEGLPGGLAIDAGSGAIAGMPESAGESEVTVVASDDRFHATRAYRLVVSDSFAPDVSELPPATAWAQYRHHLGVRGPAQDYRWQLAEPVTGMALAADGTLTGAPENEGMLAIPVTLAAADGRSRRFELALPVNPAPVIDEDGAITATQGRPLERALKAHGGTAPYRWTIGDGSLPAGLRLDADGALRGATTTLGTSEITVALKDRWDAAAQKRLTITVEAPKKDDQKQDQKQDDAKKDDQQKQDQKSDDQKPGDQKQDQDQAQQDQQKSDQDAKDPGKQDQQKPDQSQKDQDGRDQQQKDQPQKDQPQKNPQQARQDQGRPDDGKKDQGKDQQQKPGDPAQDPQQAGVAQAGADDGKRDQPPGTVRWLESLPKEDRDALRGQLLRHVPAPQRRGNPW